MLTLRTMDVGVGLNELVKEENIEFDIFPNPVNNELNLRFAEGSDELKVTVYDNLGRELYQRSIQNGTAEIKLDLNFLSSGIYLLSANDGKKTTSRRFVKQ
jgi:hypothetical protein